MAEKGNHSGEETDGLEAEMRDESAWEPIGDAPKRSALGAQVTIRLAPEDATRLRRIAEEAGTGYTALLRQWIEERLEAEDHMLLQRTVQWGGIAVTYGLGESNFQTTSSRRSVAIEAA